LYVLTILLLLVDLFFMYHFRLRSLLIFNKQQKKQDPIYERSVSIPLQLQKRLFFHILSSATSCVKYQRMIPFYAIHKNYMKR